MYACRDADNLVLKSFICKNDKRWFEASNRMSMGGYAIENRDIYISNLANAVDNIFKFCLQRHPRYADESIYQVHSPLQGDQAKKLSWPLLPTPSMPHLK